jgi:hypothetical protein
MNKDYIAKIRKQINKKFDNCKPTDKPQGILTAEELEVYALQFQGSPDRTYGVDYLTKNR